MSSPGLLPPTQTRSKTLQQMAARLFDVFKAAGDAETGITQANRAISAMQGFASGSGGTERISRCIRRRAPKLRFRSFRREAGQQAL